MLFLGVISHKASFHEAFEKRMLTEKKNAVLWLEEKYEGSTSFSYWFSHDFSELNNISWLTSFSDFSRTCHPVLRPQASYLTPYLLGTSRIKQINLVIDTYLEYMSILPVNFMEASKKEQN